MAVINDRVDGVHDIARVARGFRRLLALAEEYSHAEEVEYLSEGTAVSDDA